MKPTWFEKTDERLNTDIDIKENDIFEQSEELLATLLRDHTTGRNIFWATDMYEERGAGYGYHDEILVPNITGENGTVIRPRAAKSKEEQSKRVKDKAEVFTPSWVCNAQNNLIDNAWFGREGVFNTEYTADDGTPCWKTNESPVTFPEGKTWRDYVRDTRLEITCGEAPYLCSRYDTTTGDIIPLADRIGLLDRKLRVVSENVNESGKWLEWAQEAYKSCYGYEWQGDSLIIARETLLYTFIDFYSAKFGRAPLLKSLLYMAYIISWNVFQMDGLKFVVPDSCHDVPFAPPTQQLDLFGSPRQSQPELPLTQPCFGCKTDNAHRHNGQYCLIRDWKVKDREKQKIKFVSLLKI